MNAEPDILKGTYEIIEKIGSGGGGDVYRAFHTRLKVEVIIKKIHNNILNYVNTRAEADILKNLKSPYLPKVLDYIETKDGVFTVMEFIPGNSLRQYLDEGKRFSQKDIIKWSRQLAEAVKYLHTRNPVIIHSDIKPDNIMLTPSGDICLIDFNISLSAEKGKAEVAGITNGYSPPEQYPKKKEEGAKPPRNKNKGSHADDEKTVMSGQKAASLTEEKTSIMGENELTGLIDEDTVVMVEEETTTLTDEDTDIMEDKETALIPEDTPTEMIRSDKPVVLIDARSDIYSMGATIYHLLTGKRPESSLGKVTPLTEYKNIKISDGMLYIVQRCMEKKPEKRFQTADDLLKALTKINKLDRRYKSFRRKKEFSYIFVMILLSASVIAVKTGIDTLAREKEEKYDLLMNQAAEYIENEQYERVKEVYDEAVKLFENENEAYRMYALALYKQRDYEACTEFVRDMVETNSQLIKDNEMAELYSIVGNSYYELGKYEPACRYMEDAIKINDTVRNYYRDYAVFLARNGDMETAGQVVEICMEKGISGADLSYVNAELNFMEERYDEAVKNAEDVVATAEDEYLKMRAYVIAAQSYSQLSQTDKAYVEKKIKILNEAVDTLDETYTVALLNMLAQEYIDNDMNIEAIETIDRIIERGMGTYSLHYSRAVLYQKEDEFEKADSAYKQIIDLFGENHEIYKRLAFLEADKQMSRENSERDYSLFKTYYDKSVELYASDASTEADVEMDSLNILYEDIKAGGWFK